MARIVIATTGTLGDLHPFLAIGRQLSERGHDVIIATAGQYRGRIRREGLEWRRMRPDIQANLTEEQAGRLLDRRYGLDRTLDELLLPVLAESAQDIIDAASGADILVGSSLALGVGPAARRLRIPYVTACLQPMMMYSARDPWVPAHAPWARGFHSSGRLVGWPMRAHMRRKLAPRLAAVAELRRQWGIADEARHDDVLPVSPHLHLALFSSIIGGPQTDWPAQTMQTGFAFHDGENTTYPTPPALLRFLDEGEPPLVFTLGSSAAHAAGTFYAHALQAANALSQRALLLTGPAPASAQLPSTIAQFAYAPYGLVFPRAAAIVHQGGIGTTASALRAGKRMIVVPFAFDQEDNAARVLRMGAGYRVDRDGCTTRALTERLARLLVDEPMTSRCSALAATISEEDGALVAAQAIERVVTSGGAAG